MKAMAPSQETIEQLIRILAEAEGLPSDVCLKQCNQESEFRQDALSPRGAYGLFQLMPGTARELGVDRNKWHENCFGGIKYLGQMFRMFGSMDKALAAYNWGPGNLQKHLRIHKQTWREHLPQETAKYLGKILGG